MGTEWTNEDGLVVQFGTRDAEDDRAGVTRTAGETKEYIVDFTYDNLPVASTDGSYATIPANSLILSSRLFVTELFAGGTSYAIGMEERDGTDIDADGLDAEILLAAIDADGDIVIGDGALVGATIGAEAGMPLIVATDTFTAGAARLIIEYV